MDPIDLGQRLVVAAVTKLRQSLGRDPSMAELTAEGLSATAIKDGVRQGVLEKYQVQVASGSLENRFKIKKNIYALRRL